MSALKLYKHTCHFCEALERAALRVFNVMEDFLARIQTANKAAAMAARGDNDQAKAQCCRAYAAPKDTACPSCTGFFQVRWWQMGHANETVPANALL